MNGATGASLSYEAAAGLVETVGTPDFGGSLMKAGQEVLGADFCTLFLFRREGSPACLAASGIKSTGLAQQASRKYIERHWQMDPTLSLDMSGEIVMHHFQATQFSDGAYRHECYDVLNIGDRLTVLFLESSLFLRLSFYRSRRRWPFGDPEMGKLTQSQGLFREASRRHHSLSAASGIDPATGVPSMDVMASRLSKLGRGLSDREIQVCCRIISGMTTEAIALDLGVGVASVVTYRKRSYAKLGICSQNELFAKCLSA
jgi:DNA-binding CsgD family transcriptional regulator